MLSTALNTSEFRQTFIGATCVGTGEIRDTGVSCQTSEPVNDHEHQ